MTDCDHGSPVGTCPVCEGARPDMDDVTIGAERVAAYDGPCVFDCADRVEVGDPIAAVLDGDDLVGWAHLDCAAQRP